MLGIDVSKGKLDAALIHPLTRDRLWGGVFTNDLDGIAKLLERTDPKVSLVLEPTGRYSQLVVKQATEAGRKVLLAPNRMAKDYLRSQNSRVKSDKIDALGLARLGLSNALRPYQLKSDSVEHLDQLLSARKSMAHALQRFTLQGAELAWSVDVLAPAIDALKKQIAQVDKQVKELTRSHPDFELVQRLQSIPGVGAVIAAAVASRLISKDFATADAFVAYVGLDVAVRDSGTKKGRVTLTKQGDAELRRLLYVAAMANLRCKESVFKDEYHRQRAKGRSSTAAFNIVARKIAHVCWGMKRHGSIFDPALVYRPKATPVNTPSAANTPSENTSQIEVTHP